MFRDELAGLMASWCLHWSVINHATGCCLRADRRNCQQILGIANNAVITVSASWGLGRHIMYLSGPQIVNAMKYQTIAEPIGIMSPTIGRIAFALYLFKLVGPVRLHRWILHICIWSELVVNILNIITIFAQCPHVPQIWEDTPAGVCWPKTVQSDLGYFQGGMSP